MYLFWGVISKMIAQYFQNIFTEIMLVSIRF